MFKNKKSLFVLIPITVIIWAYVGYTVFSYLHEDDEFSEQEHKLPVVNLKKKDAVKHILALNYTDPFLKQEIRTRSNNQVNNNPKLQINPLQQKTITTLPKTIDIKYMGVVENKSSGAATGLISINGKSYLVKKGQEVEGLLIKSISSDKLEAKMGKEIISISK